MDNIKIGKYISYKRKQKGLTQKELGEMLLMSDKAVSKWERGISLPDISLLPELAKIFNITVDELLNGEDNTFTVNKEKNSLYMFKLTAKAYKQVLYFQLYSKKIWLYVINLLAFIFIFGGYALFSLQQYYSFHLDIIGLLIIVLGISLFFIPILLPIIKTSFFKETEYQYTYDQENLTYIKDGRETCYKYSNFHHLYKSNDYCILINNSEKLFINFEDYKVISKFLTCPITNIISKKEKWIINSQIALTTLNILLLILELGYHIILKNLGFELIYAQLEYIIIITILLSTIICIIISKIKINLITTLSIITSSIIILIATWLISGNFVTQITYYSISPDFSSQLVLKQDKNTGKINDYHYTYLCFAKKTTSFNASSIKKISTRWLTNDCNYISYQKADGSSGIYIATYGDRSDGIAYYSVLNSLNGDWMNKYDDEPRYHLMTKNNSITINNTETFSESEIEQFGTIAITLSKGSETRYIIALNSNCIIDDNGLIKHDGTIEIIPVFQVNVPATELFCTTYKKDDQVQQNINNQKRQEALDIVNEMHSLINNKEDYNNFKSRGDLFKIQTNSNDYIEITGLAYQKEQELGGDTGVIVDTNGTNLSIKAGTINDFYVEFSTKGSYRLHDNEEISEVSYSYRIIKSYDGYLIAKIGYRIPGNIGLVALSPTIEADISNNELFHHSSS